MKAGRRKKNRITLFFATVTTHTTGAFPDADCRFFPIRLMWIALSLRCEGYINAECRGNQPRRLRT